jgi:hypothetical protein
MIVQLSGTTGDLANPDQFWRRIACYWLLNQIPEKGLSEALETLLDIQRFYQATPLQIPVVAKPPSIPVHVGKTYIRPEFHISED